MHTWPQAVEDSLLQPYFLHRGDFSVDQGCALWDSRVVIPGMDLDRLLNDLHQCISCQVTTKRTITPMEMAYEALEEN